MRALHLEFAYRDLSSILQRETVRGRFFEIYVRRVEQGSDVQPLYLEHLFRRTCQDGAIKVGAPSCNKRFAGSPPEQREVLVLRFLRELPHAEVARALGKNEQATRALQYRALRRLSSLLER